MKRHERIDAGKLFFSFSYEFLNRHMPNQGFSAHTVQSYTLSLKQFRRYLLLGEGRSCMDFKFIECTRETAYGFMGWLRDSEGNGAGTVNLRLAALKSYVTYAAERDIALFCVKAEMDTVHPVKTSERERQVIGTETMEAFVLSMPNDRRGYRDRMLILLMFETACRVSELVDIRKDDLALDGKDPYVLIRGKGKKERLVPLSPSMAEGLVRYLSLFHGEVDSCCAHLFYSRYKGICSGLTTRAVDLLLEKHARAARSKGIPLPEKVHPHMLRRSQATTLYQNGMHLELVSSLLGHSQIQTSRIYAKPSLKMMTEAMAKNSLSRFASEPLEREENEDVLAKYFGL